MNKVEIANPEFKLSFYDEADFKITTSRKTGKKVITCVLMATIKTPNYFADGNSILTLFGWGEKYIAVKAKAVCSVDDDFNEEVGKAVARAKAETAAYKRAAKMIHQRILLMDKVLDAAQKFAAKANTVVNHNANFIDMVTDPSTDLHRKVSTVDADAEEITD